MIQQGEHGRCRACNIHLNFTGATFYVQGRGGKMPGIDLQPITGNVDIGTVHPGVETVALQVSPSAHTLERRQLTQIFYCRA